MKKWFVAAAAAVLLPLSAMASNFQAGKHYEVIAEQKTASPEVKEYFSFFCGGCYAFEPIAQSLAQNLPQGVEFTKSHVDFIRAASPEIQNALAMDSRAVYVLSDHAQYAFTADANGRPMQLWRAAYDRGTERKIGSINQGSGRRCYPLMFFCVLE